MKKFLSVLTAAVCLTACAFAFTACGGDNGGNDNQTHTTHNWSTTYTQDGDRHYQTCDGCDEKQYNNHDYGTSGVCVCGKEKPVTTVEVTGVTLNESELTLEIGGTDKLTAVVKPDNATDKTVTYSVEPTGIVTVDESGNVTAVAAGTATITATAANNKTATCSVTVNAPLTNAQVLKYLNDNVLLKAAKNWATEQGLNATKVNENTVTNIMWYITKDKENITSVTLVFTYERTEAAHHINLYKIDFSTPLTPQNIKNNETNAPAYTELYSKTISPTIQAEHTALTNAICDKLFGENTTATRYIINNGNDSLDPKLGNSTSYTGIEVTDSYIKEQPIKIAYSNTVDGFVENLKNSAKYYISSEEKSIVITGDKLADNDLPF